MAIFGVIHRPISLRMRLPITRLLTCFILLFLFTVESICQTDPVFARQINSGKGLSSEEFNYYLYRDSYGYLWISAMNGLNRYDGHTIRQYYTGERSPHELWDNNLQSDLIEDAQGNLWFTTVYGLNVYRRDKDLMERFVPAGMDTTLLEGASVFGYCPDQQKILLNGPSDESRYYHTYEVDPASHTVRQIESDSSFTGIKVDFLEEGVSGWTYLTTSSGQLNIISCEDSTAGLVQSFPLPFLSNGRLYDLKIQTKGRAFLAHSTGVFSVDLQTGAIQQLVNSETDSITQIVDLEFGEDSLMYIASRNDGLFVQNLNKKEIEQVFVRENENLYAFRRGVSRLYGDQDGNFWISTDGNGIYQINPEKDRFRTFAVIPNFPQVQESVSAIDWSEGEEVVWVTTMKDIYAVSTSGEFLPTLTKITLGKLRAAKQGARIFCVLSGDQGELIVGTELGLFVQVDRASPFREIQLKGRKAITTSLGQLNGGEILAGIIGQPPTRLDLKTKTLQPFETDLNLKIPMHFLELNRGGLYISNSEKSLYYFPEYDGENLGEEIELNIPGQIAGLVSMQNGNVVIVGTDEGLRILQKTDSTMQLSNYLLYEGRGLKSLQVENDSILWLGTNQGVIRYEYGNMDRYTTVDGLASNGASVFAPALICQDQIFFPSQNGLSMLNRSRGGVSPDQYLPAITDILVNQERVMGFVNEQKDWVAPDGKSTLEFEPSQRSLTFFFSGLNLLDPASQAYRVKLSPGNEAEFVVENDYRARFTNLDPGEYTLEVETGTPGSTLRTTLPFRVLPYWYERTSVRLGGIILLLLIMIAVAYSRIRNLRRDRELAQTRADNFELELEVKRVQNDVLRQQMNPHFLNNALNIVLARTKENQTLHTFVGKVSGLVRDIFNFAWKQEISLEEELIMLERYLSAEKSIRGLDLSWSLKLPEDDHPANLEVPPMILQPFAENAIKHGFVAPGRDTGHIDLNMTVVDDQLILAMTDNGAGRDPNKVSEHFLSEDKPSAIKVVQERLELINNRIGANIATLTFHDLKDDQGKPLGTQVVLVLPV